VQVAALEAMEATEGMEATEVTEATAAVSEATDVKAVTGADRRSLLRPATALLSNNTKNVGTSFKKTSLIHSTSALIAAMKRLK